MRLILVRHGETEANLTETIQGHLPGVLSKNGLKQIDKVAERLKDEHFDVIFSSDLDRVKRTAEAINKHHSTPIIYSKLIRERKFGVYEGKASEEYTKAREGSGKSPIEFRPEGGENHKDVRQRAERFFEDIFPKYKGKVVLVVSHGGFLNQLVGVLLKKDVAWSRELWLRNTAVTEVDVKDDGNHEARLINCTKHLDSGKLIK